MELNSEVITATPRDAATVIMLRDAPHGLEVFLVKRHGLSDVLGGAYVFPGGKLDASDALLDARLLDAPPEQLHAALGEPATPVATATGLYVAALREAFEESGVLFAQGPLPTDDAAALGKNGAFNQMVQDHALQLQTRAVLPWSRWITPVMPSVSSKRFDTRFFVSAVPEGQTALHDSHEATESVWLAPRTALEQYWSGQIELAPPQIMTLAHLSRHTSVADAMQAARSSLPPVILPEAFNEAGERVICYPGDPQHTVRDRAMPGPTRLHYRNLRFEPAQGFEALFA